jgi:tRNA A37 threonylcarbamoyladenosine dehydratase
MGSCAAPSAKGMISLSPPTICNSASTELRERIVFEDNYPASKIGTLSDLVQIIDPVNPVNNVARLYTQSNVDAIIDAAMDAGDAIDAAFYAPTKQLTVTYWQKVFGSSFQG